MQSLQVPLDRLIDAPRNANRMSPAKYAGLVESIRRLDFIVPMVVHSLDGFGYEAGHYQIDDGHHRKRALLELGRVDGWCVAVEPGEDPRLVALALNRLRGETDLAVASLMIAELVDAGVERGGLGITGFTDAELGDLLAATRAHDDVDLDDLAGAEIPEEVGTPAAKPYLLDLQFRTKEDLASVRKALRRAAGKGNELSDGLLRLVRGE